MVSNDFASWFQSGSEDPPSTIESDPRLYVPDADGWEAHIKNGWQRDYCFVKAPGDDGFHLLQGGELYLQRGDEKYCLRCALRTGILTTDRLHWQHR